MWAVSSIVWNNTDDDELLNIPNIYRKNTFQEHIYGLKFTRTRYKILNGKTNMKTMMWVSKKKFESSLLVKNFNEYRKIMLMQDVINFQSEKTTNRQSKIFEYHSFLFSFSLKIFLTNRCYFKAIRSVYYYRHHRHYPSTL